MYTCVLVFEYVYNVFCLYVCICTHKKNTLYVCFVHMYIYECFARIYIYIYIHMYMFCSSIYIMYSRFVNVIHIYVHVCCVRIYIYIYNVYYLYVCIYTHKKNTLYMGVCFVHMYICVCFARIYVYIYVCVLLEYIYI